MVGMGKFGNGWDAEIREWWEIGNCWDMGGAWDGVGKLGIAREKRAQPDPVRCSC